MSFAVRLDREYMAPTWPSFGFPLHPQKLDQLMASTHGRFAFLDKEERLYGWQTIRARLGVIVGSHSDNHVHLYRHGATKYNEKNLVSGQHDTQLSAKGRQQATQIRPHLPDEIDLVVCSGLRRSIETMALSVPKEFQRRVPVRSDNRLIEVNLGTLQGRTRQHVAAFEEGDLDFAPEGGESYRQAAQRAFSALVDIFDALNVVRTSGARAVVFCHAGILRIISTLAEPGEEPENLFSTQFANAQCLRLHSNRIRLPEYWG
jgi:broad specificity phosphatase PhoE